MRFIPRIDIKSDYVIKSIRYEGLRNLGKPGDFAKKYNEQGATEIFLIDCVSSLYRRDPTFSTITSVADQINIPLTFCGGISSLEFAKKAFESGADKIAMNTALFQNERLIDQIANNFGQQSVVVSIEAKRINRTTWECYTYNGREKTNTSVIDWVKKVQDLGAGEIFLSSVDFDGTEQGFDLNLAREVLSIAKIPVVISSGAASKKHLTDLLLQGTPSGISLGSALHYDKLKISDLKEVGQNVK